MFQMIFLNAIISISTIKTAHLPNLLKNQMREISLGAMGADMADINNDAYPEIFVTEMTPEGKCTAENKSNV